MVSNSHKNYFQNSSLKHQFYLFPSSFYILKHYITRIYYFVVAIKKFKESAEEDDIVKKTTKREVKMLSVLKDRSVVKMIEAFKR